MDSWRLKVQLNDKSASVGAATATGMGATVLPCARGRTKPVKINRGETERIRQLFGATRYEVLEAIAYNTKYPLWISAPNVGGASAGLLVTEAGLKQITFVGEDENSIDLSNLPMQAKAGTGNGTTTAFAVNFDANIFPAFSVGETASYLPKCYLVVDGVVTEAVVAWNSSDHNYTVTVGEVATGTITSSEGKVTVNLTFTTAPEAGKEVSIRLSTDVTALTAHVYALVGMRYACEDYMAAAVYKSENEGNLILDLQQKKKGIYYSMTSYPKEFSLVAGTKNASGLIIYGPVLFKDDDNIFVKVNSKETMVWDTWTDSTDLVDFKGGYRGLEPDGTLLTEAWDQFKDIKKYPVDIYFDTTANEAIPTAFSALRDGFAKYKTFLYPQAVCTAADMIAKIPLSLSNRGIKTFWGAAYIQNPYEPTGDLISTLMGEVAAKYADALVYSYGGRACAWADENQVGGQLSMGRIVEFVYNCTEDEAKAMDTGRVNPIGPNELFGPIIMSRRSTDKSSGDYSYADYSAIVDYCVERIYNEVLPYQLIKFNDDEHRATVRNKADLILKPLLAKPNNVIQEYAIKCDAENNGDDVQAAESFVLTVAIKVTRKSETILFNFINSASGASVTEDVA